MANALSYIAASEAESEADSAAEMGEEHAQDEVRGVLPEHLQRQAPEARRILQLLPGTYVHTICVHKLYRLTAN